MPFTPRHDDRDDTRSSDTYEVQLVKGATK